LDTSLLEKKKKSKIYTFIFMCSFVTNYSPMQESFSLGNFMFQTYIL